MIFIDTTTCLYCQSLKLVFQFTTNVNTWNDSHSMPVSGTSINVHVKWDDDTPSRLDIDS